MLHKFVKSVCVLLRRNAGNPLALETTPKSVLQLFLEFELDKCVYNTKEVQSLGCPCAVELTAQVTLDFS